MQATINNNIAYNKKKNFLNKQQELTQQSYNIISGFIYTAQYVQIFLYLVTKTTFQPSEHILCHIFHAKKKASANGNTCSTLFIT